MSAAPEARLDRPAIALAILTISIVGVGLSLSAPLLSIAMERQGVSSTLNGLNTALGGLANIAIAPLAPRIAQRFGVRATLIAALVAGGVAILLFPATPFPVWFPLRVLLGGALGLLFVMSEFWIVASTPPERRGFIMGVYATVLSLGFAAGPFLLLVIGSEGWPPFIAGAILFFAPILALALWRFAGPTLQDEGGRSFLDILVAVPAAAFAALVFGAVETGAFSLLPVYGLRQGYSAESAALMVSFFTAGNMLLQIPIGLIADRVDRRLLLLIVALIGVAGALLLPFVAATPTALFALLLAWGGVIGALYTVGLAHLGSRFAGADLARANGAFVMLYSTGLMLGAPLIGVGMDAANPHGFAWTIAAMFAAYAGLVAWRMAVRRT